MINLISQTRFDKVSKKNSFLFQSIYWEVLNTITALNYFAEADKEVFFKKGVLHLS